MIESLWNDLRYGVRSLIRAPGFTAVAVLTIALGIGANSAIFSIINAVVRRPLAYPAPNELMFITTQFPTLNFNKFWVSPPEYLEFKQHTKSFAAVGAYTTSAVNVSEGERPERVPATFVTASMFDVLNVRPERGQVFTPEQDAPGTAPVVVLSHEIWQRMFGADAAIVGKQIEINGVRPTVLGVMPAGFDLHDNRTQVWMPLRLPPNPTNRGSHGLYGVGRLASGVTPAQATTELNAMLKQWSTWSGGAHAPNDTTHRMQMAPLRTEVLGNVNKALWVLQGAVVLVLLIACANVANLLLARAESRHKEFAVRAALGAGRMRILRQFISEGVIISIVGAALGLGVAHWGLQAMLAANPNSIPRSAEVGLDPTVLIFTMGVAVAVGIIFGLAPLLHMREKAVSIAIKEGGVRTTANAGRNRVRRGLVVAEIALAVMLVIGAGLLLRSFSNLTRVDLGFDPDAQLTYGVVLPAVSYPDSQRVVGFFGELMGKLRQLPGVEAVAAMQGLPPFRQVNANDTQFEGRAQEAGAPPANVDYYQTVTADYFTTMGISMARGRGFELADATGGPVVVINEALAKRFYPNQDPLGRRIRPPYGPNVPFFTIVGVAKDVKQGGVENPAGTELYFNFEQLPRQVGFAPRQMNVVMRTRQEVAALAPSIRATMAAMDRSLPIVSLRSMDEVVGAAMTRQRLLSRLLGIFAIVALSLAAVGTYGILSYMVAERQREIGIRMALGASGAQVMRHVLNQGLGMALIGIVLGVGGALALSRLIATLLYGVSPSDPATFGAVSAIIAVVAAAACVVPMLRAMGVDPLTAMRNE